MRTRTPALFAAVPLKPANHSSDAPVRGAAAFVGWKTVPPTSFSPGMGAVDGYREILGIWAGDGGEGAKQWLATLGEIRNRGVNDVCLVLCDGLAGLPEAVNRSWPQAIVQRCRIHLGRATGRWLRRWLLRYLQEYAANPPLRCPKQAEASATG
jgi:hypothetical protein